MLAFGGRNNPDGALDTYEPSDPEHFGFSAQVFVGGAMSDECDSFDVTVCSPSWFASEVAARGMEHFNRAPRGFPEDVHPGTDLWFMHRWDRARFEEALSAAFPKTSEDVANVGDLRPAAASRPRFGRTCRRRSRRAGVDKLAP